MRHERFQRAMGAAYKTVGDFQHPALGVSEELRKVLHPLAKQADTTTPVYVFKEVALNRLQKQSRRADIVIYIPGVHIVYIEYKTIETPGISGSSTDVHRSQLRDTHNNLLASLTYHCSLLGSDVNSRVIPVTVFLVSRRFWTQKVKDDVVLEYKSPNAHTGVREPNNTDQFVRLFSQIGRRLE